MKIEGQKINMEDENTNRWHLMFFHGVVECRMMNNIWSEVSEKLNEEVDRADEVIEPLLNEDPNDIEISHWWDFLSKLSGIPRDELIKNAIEIKENKDDKEKKEIEYCELLKIEKPPSYHFCDPLVRCQISSIFKIKIPEKSLRTPWIFRWIYSTDSNKIVETSKKNPGNTLSYIKYMTRKGEIKFDRLFKRASFTTEVRTGTPEKWSPGCLSVGYCISVKQLVKERGFNDIRDIVMTYGLGNKVPACCRMGCEVLPNETCEHGCQSILLATGIRNLWKILYQK